MKAQEFLNKLSGWSRIGLVAYVLWIIFWINIALSIPHHNSPFMTNFGSYVPDWHFLWGKFIAVIFAPLAIWNGKKLYAWIREGFNKDHTA